VPAQANVRPNSNLSERERERERERRTSIPLKKEQENGGRIVKNMKVCPHTREIQIFRKKGFTECQ
jgi:hypothetical protein